MSQPEMQPEGTPGDGGRGQEPRRAWQRAAALLGSRSQGRGPGDLTGRPFPHGDWGEPADRLDALYAWTEESALRAADWYLRDRRGKRRAARALRAGVAAGVSVGAALPLIDLAGGWHGGAPWGYAALLIAAVCGGCDRYFGATAGWMRDVATAQAIQRRLEALQFDWASESVREVLGPAEGTASEAAERCLGVLRRFHEDIGELVRSETGDWMTQFRAGSVPRTDRSAPPWSGPRAAEAPGQPGGGRFTLPPGARPNMPRQRPPEPPR